MTVEPKLYWVCRWSATNSNQQVIGSLTRCQSCHWSPSVAKTDKDQFFFPKSFRLRILKQSSNPLSGSWKSQVSCPWRVKPVPHTGLSDCLRMLLSWFRKKDVWPGMSLSSWDLTGKSGGFLRCSRSPWESTTELGLPCSIKQIMMPSEMRFWQSRVSMFSPLDLFSFKRC